MDWHALSSFLQMSQALFLRDFLFFNFICVLEIEFKGMSIFFRIFTMRDELHCLLVISYYQIKDAFSPFVLKDSTSSSKFIMIFVVLDLRGCCEFYSYCLGFLIIRIFTTHVLLNVTL